MTIRLMPDHGNIQQKHLTDPLIHLSLEKRFPTACAGKWLVIDLTQSIVTLLSSTTVVIKLDSLSVPSRRIGLGSGLSVSPDSTYNCSTSPSTSTQPARIWCHQAFSPDALRVLLTLLRFPDICPYAYLLAALQVPESLLITMLMEASDPLPMTFYQMAENAKGLLQGVIGQRREQHLRHLRRVMTDVMAGTNHLGLTVLSLRAVGYRLQPTIHQQDRLDENSISRRLDEHRIVNHKE